MKTRQQIIREAYRIRQEIEQIFTDADHWNTSCRKPNEAKIDPDPDGELVKRRAEIDAMLRREKQLGNNVPDYIP